MDKPKENDPFVMFVSAKRGFMVRRKSTKRDIGVTADGKGNVTWDEKTIHAITEDDMLQMRRAVKAGELTEHTREAWEKQRQETKAAAKQQAADAAIEQPVAVATEKDN